jgi:hypothetical protein
MESILMKSNWAVFPPLYIEYGDHEDRPVVVIRRVAGLADAID